MLNNKCFFSTAPSGYSVDEMIQEAKACLAHVQKTYPSAQLLIGGSVAFYFNFPGAYTGQDKMSDIDAVLTLPKEDNEKVFDWAWQDNSFVKLGDNYVIVPYGQVDLHIGANNTRLMQQCKIACSIKNVAGNGLSVMSRDQIARFYKKLNREKDQYKLQYLNGAVRTPQ